MMDVSVRGLAGEILSLSLGPEVSYKTLKESIALALSADEVTFDLVLPGPVRVSPGLWLSTESCTSFLRDSSGAAIVTVVRRAPALAEALQILRDIFLAVPVSLHRTVSLDVLFARFAALSALRNCEELFGHLAHHAKGPWNLELRGLLRASPELQASARVCASLAELAPGLLSEMNPELFRQSPSLCPDWCVQNLPRACYRQKDLMASLFDRLQKPEVEQSRVLTLLGLLHADVLADFASAFAIVTKHAIAIQAVLAFDFSDEEQAQLIEAACEGADACTWARFRPPMKLLGRAALLAWCRKCSRLPVATLCCLTREQIALFHAQPRLDTSFWLEALENMQGPSPLYNQPCRNAWLLHPVLRGLLRERTADGCLRQKLEVALRQAQTDIKQALGHLLLRSDASETIKALPRSTLRELLAWAGV